MGALVDMHNMIQAYRKAPTEQDLVNCPTMAVACAVVKYVLAGTVAEASKPTSRAVR